MKPPSLPPAPFSVCFVAHNAYGALTSQDTGHIGGIERQQAMMAHWLARRGHRVCMVTWDEGQPDSAQVNGVTVYKICRRDAGMRGARFVYPRWVSLVRAMRRAKASVYYYNLGDLALGQVVLWAHTHGRRVLYSVASDPACDPMLPALTPLRERVLYRHGLRHADHVIAQTQTQRQMLREGFGIEATWIPMPSVGFRDDSIDSARLPGPRDGPPRMLWVGRISHQKRPEWLLDVAERCPDMIFDIVGSPNAESAYAASIIDRLRATPNIRMHGRINHNDLGRFYREATALCCTSHYEGFPNVFLEAWSVGVPVVSTVDPDAVIATHKLGLVAISVDELAQSLRQVAFSADARQAMSAAARQYFASHHTIEAVMPMFESEIARLATR